MTKNGFNGWQTVNKFAKVLKVVKILSRNPALISAQLYHFLFVAYQAAGANIIGGTDVSIDTLSVNLISHPPS
jgi:hypothetical protein